MLHNWIQFVLVISTVVVSGCAGPLHRTLEQELRDQLQTAGRTYNESVADAAVIEIKPTHPEVEARPVWGRGGERGPGAGWARFRSRPSGWAAGRRTT